MRTGSAPALSTPPAATAPLRRAGGRGDRFMRGMLRIPAGHPADALDPTATSTAHRALRVSMVISGLRCLATYVVIPILVPVVGFLGVLAAPVSIALCLLAMVSGTAGVRRFWVSDHRAKWVYTWFMAFVFSILTVFLVTDITRLVS